MGHEIAILEDEPTIRHVVAKALERRGYAVRAFGTLREADAALRATPPDLMILDVVLPDGCGLDLIGAVRASDGAAVPAIVLSGLCDEQDVIRGFDAGAVDYLAKPFDAEQLLARVAVQLARKARRQEGGAPPTPPPGALDDLQPGQVVFGRYTVVSRLGQGGYGTVYLAADGQRQGHVALKIPTVVPEDPAATARFIRESYGLSSVQSRHVVRFRDVGFVGGQPFYAMEVIAGESLWHVVTRDGALSEAELRPLARGLLEALEAVRKAGLLHRDVKPSNVLLRGDDPADPVLIDFGLVRLECETGLTDANLLIGTADFLAPELVREGRQDHRSDLFALGLTLRFALAGDGLYPHLKGMKLLDAIATRPVPPPPVRLSPGFAALLERLCAGDPERRPDTAGAALAELDALTEPPSTERHRARNGHGPDATRAERR